jgi:hypothetical protein
MAYDFSTIFDEGGPQPGPGTGSGRDEESEPLSPTVKAAAARNKNTMWSTALTLSSKSSPTPKNLGFGMEAEDEQQGSTIVNTNVVDSSSHSSSNPMEHKSKIGSWFSTTEVLKATVFILIGAAIATGASKFDGGATKLQQSQINKLDNDNALASTTPAPSSKSSKLSKSGNCQCDGDGDGTGDGTGDGPGDGSNTVCLTLTTPEIGGDGAVPEPEPYEDVTEFLIASDISTPAFIEHYLCPATDTDDGLIEGYISSFGGSCDGDASGVGRDLQASTGEPDWSKLSTALFKGDLQIALHNIFVQLDEWSQIGSLSFEAYLNKMYYWDVDNDNENRTTPISGTVTIPTTANCDHLRNGNTSYRSKINDDILYNVTDDQKQYGGFNMEDSDIVKCLNDDAWDWDTVQKKMCLFNDWRSNWPSGSYMSNIRVAFQDFCELETPGSEIRCLMAVPTSTYRYFRFKATKFRPYPFGHPDPHLPVQGIQNFLSFSCSSIPITLPEPLLVTTHANRGIRPSYRRGQSTILPEHHGRLRAGILLSWTLVVLSPWIHTAGSLPISPTTTAIKCRTQLAGFLREATTTLHGR